MTKSIVLTAAERAILSSYDSVLDGLAEYLGNGYEIVLHSLENLDHSAVKVINGHHSNRAVGAPITDLALKLLEDIQRENGSGRNRIYNNRSKNGSPIKAATLPILGENERLIGLICINFYMDTPLSDLLGSLTGAQEASNGVKESLSGSAEDLIAHSIAEIKASISNNTNISYQNRNKAMIEHLFSKGIFRLKKAVPKVADIMGISPNTVYLHLRALKKRAAQTESRADTSTTN